jgi:coenzyme Q-binding protein COQ10
VKRFFARDRDPKMTEHSESRIVPYTADLMYAVVADVERYPEFLPWVVALRVKSRAREGEREILMAEMAVGYRALRERYISKVTLDPAAQTIDVVAVEGPFRVLENHWRFTPEGESTRIDFRVGFEFSSRLLQVAAAQAFGKVLLKLTDAFEARAASLSRSMAQGYSSPK